MSTIDEMVASWRDTALVLARVLVAALFLVSAYQSFENLGGAAAFFAWLGFPMPGVVAPAVMVFEFVAGILLVAGFQTRIVVVLFGGFTLMAAITGHTDFASANQLNHFLKNLAIVGGCAALFVSGAGAYSVDFMRE